MMIFSKQKVVISPSASTTDIYFDRKNDNHFSFNINLLNSPTPAEIDVLLNLFKKNHVTEVEVIVPGSIVIAKSFIYDAQISSIDIKEVVEIAQVFINFPITAESIEYKLLPTDRGKTIIKSKIYDLEKYHNLKNNLQRLSLKKISYVPVFDLVARAMSMHFSQEYFMFYPESPVDYLLILAKGDSVYLTNTFHGPSIDFQKTANYANLYFSTQVNKIFLPENSNLNILSEQPFEKTSYQESQLIARLTQVPGLSLPVAVLFSKNQNSKAVIINSPPVSNSIISKPKTMETKKNILPIIAVFIVAASIASIIFYFVTTNKKDKTTEDKSPVITDNISEPTSTPEATPTLEKSTTPTPEEEEDVTPTKKPKTSVTPTTTSSSSTTVNKKIKIQVLNATDITGQAAKLKDKLTKLGFTSVATGNSTSTTTKNTVQLKSAYSNLKTYLTEEIGDYFPATYTSSLEEDSTYDAILTIGTEL